MTIDSFKNKTHPESSFYFTNLVLKGLGLLVGNKPIVLVMFIYSMAFESKFKDFHIGSTKYIICNSHIFLEFRSSSDGGVRIDKVT